MQSLRVAHTLRKNLIHFDKIFLTLLVHGNYHITYTVVRWQCLNYNSDNTRNNGLSRGIQRQSDATPLPGNFVVKQLGIHAVSNLMMCTWLLCCNQEMTGYVATGERGLFQNNSWIYSPASQLMQATSHFSLFTFRAFAQIQYSSLSPGNTAEEVA